MREVAGSLPARSQKAIAGQHSEGNNQKCHPPLSQSEREKLGRGMTILFGTSVKFKKDNMTIYHRFLSRGAVTSKSTLNLEDYNYRVGLDTRGLKETNYFKGHDFRSGRIV